MRDIKLSLNDRTLVAAITAWKAGKRWLDAIGMLGTLSSGGSLVSLGMVFVGFQISAAESPKKQRQTAGANNIPYTETWLQRLGLDEHCREPKLSASA